MLTILVGLPGSGKSTMAKERAKGLAGAHVYEDVLGGFRPLDPKRGLFDLLKDIQAGRPVFADDIFLCLADYRAIFADLIAPFVPPGYSVEWIYFANSPEVCLRNVERRSRLEPDNVNRNRAALEWLRKLPSDYHIPEGIVPIQVSDYGT